MRAAFDETMKDPDFLRDAEKNMLSIDPTTGAELEQIVRTIISTPRSIIDRVKSSYKG